MVEYYHGFTLAGQFRDGVGKYGHPVAFAADGQCLQFLVTTGWLKMQDVKMEDM